MTWHWVSFELEGLPDRSENVMDSFCCRRQSCRRVLWKAAVDSVRNANTVNALKVIFSNVEESGKWSRIRILGWITGTKTKLVNSSHWYSLSYSTNFQWNRLITFAVILITDKHTNTNNHTSQCRRRGYCKQHCVIVSTRIACGAIWRLFD